jgi:endonuclease VIII
MPEGDTLFRIAEALRPVLVEQSIHLTLPRQAVERADWKVTAVAAHGKNLQIDFENGFTLHTHLKMTGLWHVYALGAAWNRPQSSAVAVLTTSSHCAVCFKAPIVRLLNPLQSRALKHALPQANDVLADSFDQQAAVTRMLQLPEVAAGVALLDQSALAGVGNVYKSEAFFAARLSPFRLMKELPRSEVERLVATAAEMMRKNRFTSGLIKGGPGAHYQYQRTTRSGCEVGKGPIAVYGRVGRGCYQCGASIEMRRQGPMARSTYFCRQCQSVTG